MISNIVTPTKSQLISNIQKLRNPKIETYEISSDTDKKNLNKKIDTLTKKGNVYVN